MMELFLKRTIRYASLICILGAMTFHTVSCTTTRTAHHRTKVPPGHAKKYHGERSAKRYAPGQQKKTQQHHHGNKRKKN